MICKEPYPIDILRKMRETLGISQNEIGSALGYTAGSIISNLELHRLTANRRQLMAYEAIIHRAAENRGIPMKKLEESVGYGVNVTRDKNWCNPIRSW